MAPLVTDPEMKKLSSLEKAIFILDALAKAKSAGPRELSAELGLPVSTVHRLLTALTASNYLRQDPQTKKYRLSLKFLELGAAVREELDLVTVARSHMNALMEAASETVNLAFLDWPEMVYVEQAANPNSFLRMFTRVGARAPVHTTGVGKACLAFLPETSIREYWKSAEKRSYTANTITEESALMAELDLVRSRGFAVDNEEMEIGVRCVAAAIRQEGGEIVGAVSVSGPSTRLRTDNIDEMGDMVRQTAALISVDLGYREGFHNA